MTNTNYNSEPEHILGRIEQNSTLSVENIRDLTNVLLSTQDSLQKLADSGDKSAEKKLRQIKSLRKKLVEVGKKLSLSKNLTQRDRLSVSKSVEKIVKELRTVLGSREGTEKLKESMNVRLTILSFIKENIRFLPKKDHSLNFDTMETSQLQQFVSKINEGKESYESAFQEFKSFSKEFPLGLSESSVENYFRAYFDKGLVPPLDVIRKAFRTIFAKVEKIKENQRTISSMLDKLPSDNPKHDLAEFDKSIDSLLEYDFSIFLSEIINTANCTFDLSWLDMNIDSQKRIIGILKKRLELAESQDSIDKKQIDVDNKEAEIASNQPDDTAIQIVSLFLQGKALNVSADELNDEAKSIFEGKMGKLSVNGLKGEMAKKLLRSGYSLFSIDGNTKGHLYFIRKNKDGGLTYYLYRNMDGVETLIDTKHTISANDFSKIKGLIDGNNPDLLVLENLKIDVMKAEIDSQKIYIEFLKQQKQNLVEDLRDIRRSTSDKEFIFKAEKDSSEIILQLERDIEMAEDVLVGMKFSTDNYRSSSVYVAETMIGKHPPSRESADFARKKALVNDRSISKMKKHGKLRYSFDIKILELENTGLRGNFKVHEALNFYKTDGLPEKYKNKINQLMLLYGVSNLSKHCNKKIKPALDFFQNPLFRPEIWGNLSQRAIDSTPENLKHLQANAEKAFKERLDARDSVAQLLGSLRHSLSEAEKVFGKDHPFCKHISGLIDTYVPLLKSLEDERLSSYIQHVRDNLLVSGFNWGNITSMMGLFLKEYGPLILAAVAGAMLLTIPLGGLAGAVAAGKVGLVGKITGAVTATKVGMFAIKTSFAAAGMTWGMTGAKSAMGQNIEWENLHFDFLRNWGMSSACILGGHALSFGLTRSGAHLGWFGRGILKIADSEFLRISPSTTASKKGLIVFAREIFQEFSEEGAGMVHPALELPLAVFNSMDGMNVKIQPNVDLSMGSLKPTIVTANETSVTFEYDTTQKTDLIKQIESLQVKARNNGLSPGEISVDNNLVTYTFNVKKSNGDSTEITYKYLPSSESFGARAFFSSDIGATLEARFKVTPTTDVSTTGRYYFEGKSSQLSNMLKNGRFVTEVGSDGTVRATRGDLTIEFVKRPSPSFKKGEMVEFTPNGQTEAIKGYVVGTDAKGDIRLALTQEGLIQSLPDPHAEPGLTEQQIWDMAQANSQTARKSGLPSVPGKVGIVSYSPSSLVQSPVSQRIQALEQSGDSRLSTASENSFVGFSLLGPNGVLSRARTSLSQSLESHLLREHDGYSVSEVKSSNEASSILDPNYRKSAHNQLKRLGFSKGELAGFKSHEQIEILDVLSRLDGQMKNPDQVVDELLTNPSNVNLKAFELFVRRMDSVSLRLFTAPLDIDHFANIAALHPELASFLIFSNLSNGDNNIGKIFTAEITASLEKAGENLTDLSNRMFNGDPDAFTQFERLIGNKNTARLNSLGALAIPMFYGTNFDIASMLSPPQMAEASIGLTTIILIPLSTYILFRANRALGFIPFTASRARRRFLNSLNSRRLNRMFAGTNFSPLPATPDAPTATPDAPTATPDAPTATPDASTATPDTTSRRNLLRTPRPGTAATTPSAPTAATPDASTVNPVITTPDPDLPHLTALVNGARTQPDATSMTPAAGEPNINSLLGTIETFIGRGRVMEFLFGRRVTRDMHVRMNAVVDLLNRMQRGDVNRDIAAEQIRGHLRALNEIYCRETARLGGRNQQGQSNNSNSVLREWLRPQALIALALSIALLLGVYAYVSREKTPEEKAEENKEQVKATERAGEIADLERGAGGTPTLEIASVSPEVRESVGREKRAKIQAILKKAEPYPPLKGRVDEIQSLLKSEKPDIKILDKKYLELEVLVKAYVAINHAKQKAKLSKSDVDQSVNDLEKAVKEEVGKKNPGLNDLERLIGLIK